MLLALPFSLIAQQREAKWTKAVTQTKNAFADLRNTFSKMEKHIPVAEFNSSIQIAGSKLRKHSRSHNHRYKHRKHVRSRSEVFVLMQFSVKTRDRH
jgi:hypothetical protein